MTEGTGIDTATQDHLARTIRTMKIEATGVEGEIRTAREMIGTDDTATVHGHHRLAGGTDMISRLTVGEMTGIGDTGMIVHDATTAETAAGRSGLNGDTGMRGMTAMTDGTIATVQEMTEIALADTTGGIVQTIESHRPVIIPSRMSSRTSSPIPDPVTDPIPPDLQLWIWENDPLRPSLRHLLGTCTAHPTAPHPTLRVPLHLSNLQRPLLRLQREITSTTCAQPAWLRCRNLPTTCSSNAPRRSLSVPNRRS